MQVFRCLLCTTSFQELQLETMELVMGKGRRKQLNIQEYKNQKVYVAHYVTHTCLPCIWEGEHKLYVTKYMCSQGLSIYKQVCIIVSVATHPEQSTCTCSSIVLCWQMGLLTVDMYPYNTSLDPSGEQPTVLTPQQEQVTLWVYKYSTHFLVSFKVR